jgi:hypothetical protein
MPGAEERFPFAVVPNGPCWLAAGGAGARDLAGGAGLYSADDKNVGQVVEVTRGPDGKVESIQVAVGRWLGIGDRVVTINADDFDQLADRIRLRLAGEEVRAMPEAKSK